MDAEEVSAMANARSAAVERIVTTCRDYQNCTMCVDHVEDWIRQFRLSSKDDLLLLEEIAHVLSNTYISEQILRAFVAQRVESLPRESGLSPRMYWDRVGVMRLGGTEDSQGALVAILGEELSRRWKLDPRINLETAAEWLYFDDVLFTGHQVVQRLSNWTAVTGHEDCRVRLVLFAAHTLGRRWVEHDSTNFRDLRDAKNIGLRWNVNVMIQNRQQAGCQVLWPHYPSEGGFHWPTQFDGRPVVWRPMDSGATAPFRTDQGRQLMEDVFTEFGLHIVGLAKNPGPNIRPLGYSRLASLGFGSMVVSHRGCANTCPVVLWWGGAEKYPLNQWYPLFPRHRI